MTAALRVVRWAALVGFQERLALFTPVTWTFGWVLRLVAQVLFFALIGVLLGSVERMHYLFIGNVAAIAALGTLAAAPDSAEERYGGTLPLLVAAPAAPAWVFAGRTLLWIVEATVTAAIALLVLAPLLDYPLTTRAAWAPLILAVVALGNYGFAMFLTSLVVRSVEWSNVVFNLVFWAMAAICGVNVSVDFFPAWVEAIARILPLTHGLEALRALLGGLPLPAVAADAGRELAIGVGWMLLALASFRWFAEGGRRDGSIEFGA